MKAVTATGRDSCCAGKEGALSRCSGSMRRTAHRSAPVQIAERYCNSGPSQGRGELVNLRLPLSPVSLAIGSHAEAGETRHVVGFDELNVRDVVPVRFRYRDGGRRTADGGQDTTAPA